MRNLIFKFFIISLLFFFTKKTYSSSPYSDKWKEKIIYLSFPKNIKKKSNIININLEKNVISSINKKELNYYKNISITSSIELKNNDFFKKKKISEKLICSSKDIKDILLKCFNSKIFFSKIELNKLVLKSNTKNIPINLSELDKLYSINKRLDIKSKSKILKDKNISFNIRNRKQLNLKYTDINKTNKIIKDKNNNFICLPIMKKFRISSKFNLYRINPVTGKIMPHRGVDFAVPVSTPVLATGDGEVIVNKKDKNAGNYIVIRHKHDFITRYMHLKKSLVKLGQKVRCGDQIALSGNTGRSTGPHLHFEVWINKKAVNPMTVAFPSNSTNYTKKDCT